MDGQDFKLAIDSISNLIKVVGFDNVLILILVSYGIYFHNNKQKIKNENVNIERMERIYKESIERLADQVGKSERTFLKENLNINEATYKKMTAVTKEIITDIEKKEQQKWHIY